MNPVEHGQYNNLVKECIDLVDCPSCNAKSMRPCLSGPGWTLRGQWHRQRQIVGIKLAQTQYGWPDKPFNIGV